MVLPTFYLEAILFKVSHVEVGNVDPKGTDNASCFKPVTPFGPIPPLDGPNPKPDDLTNAVPLAWN
jgi:hypothetical protein